MYLIPIALSISLLFTACKRRIPPEYEYPQGWITTQHPLVQARSLSGRIVDPSGAPIRSVLVERTTPDLQKRLAATLTDERGEFRLRSGAGKYYLRFRFRGFNDYVLPVVVTHSSREFLVIKLELSN
jgi:hypothetical protein